MLFISKWSLCWYFINDFFYNFNWFYYFHINIYKSSFLYILTEHWRASNVVKTYKLNNDIITLTTQFPKSMLEMKFSVKKFYFTFLSYLFVSKYYYYIAILYMHTLYIIEIGMACVCIYVCICVTKLPLLTKSQIIEISLKR